MIDKLEKCPKCQNEECCLVEDINEFHKAYTCLSCGFASSDLMREGEYDVEAYEELLPELYKVIKTVDSENRVWYPYPRNEVSKGSVFAEGTSLEHWGWSAIKSVPLSKEDKKSKKFKGQKYKADATTKMEFGKDGYFEACDYIGFFNLEQ